MVNKLLKIIDSIAEKETDPENRSYFMSIVSIDLMDAAADYAKCVSQMEIFLRSNGVSVEDVKERAEKRARFDEKRHDAHNRLINVVKKVNGIAERFGCDPVFNGDTGDRVKVADFAFSLMSDLFSNRIL